jgi:hypothetical protein
MPWILCLSGCGLHHRDDDARPLHDPQWLARERESLLALLGRPPMPVTAGEIVSEPSGSHATNVSGFARIPTAPILLDELARARAARAGKPISIETRATDAGGVTMTVDLGTPPKPRGPGV